MVVVMEELELEEKLSNGMNKTTQEWQEEVTKVINHLLYESGYTIGEQINKALLRTYIVLIFTSINNV